MSWPPHHVRRSCAHVRLWSNADLQYPGCSTRAKYGPKDAPPSACQAHKRAGQYTINRHGEMLVATRDGDGKDAASKGIVAPVAVVVVEGCVVLSLMLMLWLLLSVLVCGTMLPFFCLSARSLFKSNRRARGSIDPACVQFLHVEGAYIFVLVLPSCFLVLSCNTLMNRCQQASPRQTHGTKELRRCVPCLETRILPTPPAVSIPPLFATAYRLPFPLSLPEMCGRRCVIAFRTPAVATPVSPAPSSGTAGKKTWLNTLSFCAKPLATLYGDSALCSPVREIAALSL